MCPRLAYRCRIDFGKSSCYDEYENYLLMPAGKDYILFNNTTLPFAINIIYQIETDVQVFASLFISILMNEGGTSENQKSIEDQIRSTATITPAKKEIKPGTHSKLSSIVERLANKVK